MRSTWTDERLDDLTSRVDDGFGRVDARFAQVDAQFERVNGRLDSIQRSMVFGVIAMSAAMVAGFGAVFGIIATQL